MLQVQVALLLLDLQLGGCAQQALEAAGKGQGEEQVPGLEMALCCSKAASLVGDDVGKTLQLLSDSDSKAMFTHVENLA